MRYVTRRVYQRAAKARIRWQECYTSGNPLPSRIIRPLLENGLISKQDNGQATYHELTHNRQPCELDS